MAQSFFHTRSSNVATVRVRSTKFGEIIDRNQNARPRPCRVSALRGSWRYALNDLLTSRSDQNIGRRVVSLSGGTGTVVGSISRVNRINTQCVQILLQCVLPCPLWSSDPPPATFWSPHYGQTSWSMRTFLITAVKLFFNRNPFVIVVTLTSVQSHLHRRSKSTGV